MKKNGDETHAPFKLLYLYLCCFHVVSVLDDMKKKHTVYCTVLVELSPTLNNHTKNF